MNDWPPQLWAAIVGAVGTVAGWLGKKSNARADAATKLTDGALAMVASMRDDLNTERKRVDRLEASLAAVREEQQREREWCDARINQLVQALHKEGIEVPPPPPEAVAERRG